MVEITKEMRFAANEYQKVRKSGEVVSKEIMAARTAYQKAIVANKLEAMSEDERNAYLSNRKAYMKSRYVEDPARQMAAQKRWVEGLPEERRAALRKYQQDYQAAYREKRKANGSNN